jgi:hypothetical protein
VSGIREEFVNTFRGKILIKEPPHASSSSRQCFHLQARRKRAAAKGQTVLGFQPENGNGSGWTDGQAVLALKAASFQRLRDCGELLADADNRTRAIVYARLALDALFRIHGEVEFHRLCSRE